MKKFDSLRLIVIFLLLINSTGNGKEFETDNIEHYLNLSLDELLQVKVSVASSRPSTVFNSVSVVSTIDRSMIDNFGFKSIEDALTIVSGFGVQRSYLKQSMPTSRGVLQDHYANKILYMIDGVSSWQALGGDPIIGQVDINDVERIEVLKGPASVLYGTNAYVGAINVVMKKNSSTRFSVGTGSDQMKSIGASVRGELEQGRYALSVNYRNKAEFPYTFTDGNNETGTVNEYQENTNIHADIVYKNHQITVHHYDGKESYYGGTISFEQGAGTPHTVDGFFVNYRYQQSFEDWGEFQFNALLDDQSNEFEVRVYNFPEPAPQRPLVKLFWEGRKSTLSLKHLYDIDNYWTIESGIDYEKRDSKNSRFERPDGSLFDVNVVDKKLDESSFFSQLYYASKDHNWVVGGRLVDNQLFGRNFSGRTSYVYMINPSSSIKIIAGQSFRSASLLELYSGINCCIVGEQDLMPEKSDSIELSYLNAWNNWFFQGTMYWAKYKNKILRRSVIPSDTEDHPNVFSSATRYANGKSFNAKGIEIEFKYTDKQWQSFLNLTYVNGSDDDAIVDTYQDGSSQLSSNFKYVPSLNVSTGLSHHWQKWSLAINTTYKGSSGSIDNGVDSSIVGDLTLNYYQFLANVNVHHQLVIRNFTDEEVTVPEYARRVDKKLDELPLRFGRSIGYEVTWQW